jgi:hypothetical protein
LQDSFRHFKSDKTNGGGLYNLRSKSKNQMTGDIVGYAAVATH